MKKRVLAMILCLTMLLGMIPMSVVAEGEESDAHVHTSHEGWTAVAGTGKLPTTTGKYYLTEDNMLLTAVAEIASAQEIVLCLNGKTVDCTQTKRAFRLCKGANVTICDCTAEVKDDVYTAGSIKNATNTAIMIGSETPSATLKIYDGIFQDNKISTVGSVVIAQGGSQVEIHDGAFIHNSAGTNAGAIYANNATVKVHGGTFSNNSAGTSGGAFYISNANLELHGGTIRENTAAHGGALFVQNNSNILLNGVTITENTATARGGGIDYTGNGTLKIGGTTKVTGNSIDKDTDNANNLVLVNGRKLQLDAENAPLQTGAEIGVSVCAWGSDAVPDYSMGRATVFASNATQENVAQYFKVDRPGTDHYIQQKNGNLRFALPKAEHPVEHYHTEENWTEWTQTGSLPVETGNYYLAGDVDVTASAGVQVNTAQNIVLCLNGYTVTGKDRIYRLSKGANVTICDCTSYYNESGEFIAGKLVPGTAEGGVVGLFSDGADTIVSTLTLKNILIDGTGKQNANGGAIQLGYVGANVVIEDCIIRNCTTTDRGGAIQNHSGVLQITNTLITDNTAKYGGAMMVQNNSKTTLTDVTITDNTASVYGGGINSELTVNGTGFLKVEGNTVIQNNFNSKTKHVSNVNLLNQARRVTIGELDEHASIGIIAEKSTDSSDMVSVTINEQATEEVLKHFTSDMGHEVVLEGTVLKIRGRVHTAHATDECGHGSATWTATNTLPTTAGHYYLTSNVMMTSVAGVAYNTGAEVTVCLNGYSIIGAEGCRMFRMSNGTVLNICDCTGHGQITGGSNANGGVAWLGKDSSDAEPGTLNLYGGIVTGNTSADDKALFVIGGGNLKVAGGQISDNAARVVLLQNGSFTMTGGKISDNEFNTGDGVVLRMQNGSFTMTGGEISGNINNKYSGAIRIDNGTALLSGGKISGNQMANAGGLLLNGGKTTLEGVAISNNTANGNGGGVYIMGASEVILNGALITDNTAAKNGGGIYNVGTGKLTVGGSTKIADNTAAGKASNLDLANGNAFLLETLTEGAAIGITGKLDNMSADGKLAVATEVAQSDAANYFTSDQNMKVVLEEGTLYLSLGVDSLHKAHATDECGHDNVTWKFWLDGTSLPTTAGHYYLTQDVTLGALGGAMFNTGAEVTICLNGFTISGADTGRAFRLSNGTVLNICDCTGKGEITNCNNSSKAGVAWLGKDASDAEPGTLNLYGGTVTGCHAPIDSALFHVEGGNFNMYGGQIAENDSRILLIVRGDVQIHGGKITKNTYGLRDGGVLRMSNGTFTMTGGEISNNVNEGFGGALRIDKGTVAITGGKLCGNKAVNGSVMIVTGGKVTVEGAEISGNEVTSNGTVYIMGDAEVTLNGANITGNTAGAAGAGVYYVGTGTLTIGGNTKITDNTAAGRTSNLQLVSGKTFQIGTLTEKAKIGVTCDLKSMPDDGKLVFGTGAVQTDAATYFVSDQNMKLEQKESSLCLVFDVESLHKAHATDECSHESVSWKIWLDGTSLPTTAGHYYLTQDVTLGALGGAMFNTGAEVTICLNGFTISGAGTGRAFRLSNGTVLNICDCSGRGLITNCNNNKAGVAWIGKDATDADPGTLNLYGGKITGCVAGTNSALFHLEGGNLTVAGGQICDNKSRIVMMPSGSFTMSGGKICKNEYSAGDGVVLRMTGGSFTMTGGEISGNENTAFGGTIRIDKGTAQFNGGKITGNKAKSSSGVLVTGGTVNLESVEISYNETPGAGAGLYIMNEATVTVGSGTKIMHNTAKGTGGAGIHFIGKSAVTLNGAIITDNVAAQAGGGVYHNGTGTLTISGSTKITGNTAAGRANNLQLANGITFRVGTLAEGAQIGVVADLKSMSDEGKLVIGTDAIQTDAAAYFISDQNMGVEQKDGTVYLTLRADALHTPHASDACGHDNVTWKFWADDASLPLTEGHYYLTQNVTLGALGGAIFNTGAEVTICLNGFTISGAGTGRAFRLSNGSVLNVCDCTGKGLITNCNNNKAGVAWIGKDETDAEPGTLNLYGGKITGCHAGMDSALFHLEGGNFTMHDGLITENDSRILFVSSGAAEIHGGKITNNIYSLRDGSVLRMPDGTFTMTGGEISGNVNEAYSGALRVDKGTATITGGKISGNKAMNGAAIIMAGGKLSVTDTEICDNVATSSGGAIYLFGEVEAYLGKGTVISGNSAGNNAGAIYTEKAKITMEDVTVTGNTAAKTGGGIYFTHAEATMTRVSVTKNTAETGAGVVSGRTNQLTIKDSSIADNTATNAGGGLLIQSAADVTLVNSKVSGNSAANNGGGVYVSYDGHLNNQSGTIENNSAKGFGGGVYLADQMTMSGGSVSGNYAKKEGGGIYVTEGSHKDADGNTIYNAAVLTMTGGSISYNRTDVNGGGVCVRGQKGLFNLYGGTISNNTATNTKSGTGHGGGVLAQGKGTFYMYGGTIRDNKATTAGGGIRVAPNAAFGIYGGTVSGNTAWRGAGIYVEEDFVFENCTVTGNTADNEGGGLYVSGCKMTMNSGTISNNQIADKNDDGAPDGSSGGMTIRASAECTMNGGQIIGNIGRHAGGVVVQSGGIFTMKDGLFAENKAYYSGGGLYNSRSTVHLLGGTFKDNVAVVQGGAVFSDGVMTVDGCEFIGNKVTAESGGAGSGGAVKVGQKSSAEIKNAVFTDNYVMGNAAAVDISYKSSAKISGCTFTNNTASANGGALRMYTVGTLDMDDCVFNGNTSMGSGGAMCVESTSNVHVRNTSFESNKGTSGGAVYIGAITRADFANCTFTGNTSNRFGSAIYSNGGVYLTDTTITDQQGKAHAVSLTAEGSDGESFMTGINQFKGNVIIDNNEGGGLELLEGAFINIHGDGLGEQAKILVTQPQGAITGNIFGAYNYVREGDVYTLTKGDLALRQADPATVEEEIVPETTEPETPSETPNSAKRTVLIIFGVLLAGSAVLTVVAVLAVKKMKKRNSVEQTK